MKKAYIIFLIGVLITSIVFSPFNGDVANAAPTDPVGVVSSDDEDKEPLKPPKFIPDGSSPTAHQKKITRVKGERDSEPGVYWYQLDNGKFRANSYRAPGGIIDTENAGTNENPWPEDKTVVDKIEMKSNPLYEPHRWVDSNGQDGYHPSKVTNQIITEVHTIEGRQGFQSQITGLEITDLKTAVLITSLTGKSFDHFDYQNTGNKRWSNAIGGYLPWYKYTASYYTPINIFWRGDYVEQKKITLTGKTTIKVGEETKLTAAVATMAAGQTEYGTPVDVSTGIDEWDSNRQSVVELVGTSGRIKGVSEGTSKITAIWIKDGYKLTATITVTVDDDEEIPPNPIPPSCTAPAPSGALEGKYMDPVVTAKILADQRGSEMFDVLQGIPTSESLYGNILARNYLFQNKFVNMKGTCTFSVNVEKTWSLTWDPGKTETDEDGNEVTVPDPQSDEETVTEMYTIERPYSFWTIDNLEVYKIDKGTLENYALPGGEISIYPEGYQAPSFNADQTGNFYPPPDPGTVTAPGGSKDGGTSRPSPDYEDLKSFAEDAVEKVEVTNDTLNFNNQTIMNGNRVEETGPTPGAIPAPTVIGQDVLYSPNNMISSNKINRANTTSKGEIFYGLMPGNINGGSDQKFTIHGINTVTVHTPVVNYSSVTDDQAHNQKTKPNYNRAAFILDRPFTVRIPTNGQHTDYPGYGNRDYAKYFRTKQVRFPFDVYNGNKTQFIPKDTWIDIPVNQLDTEFFLPVWVDEGNYQVYFRNIAENAPSGYSWEQDANLNLVNHAAVDEVSVEVIGRLYDFHITDIADYNWERVFRAYAGSKDPSGASYWVGQNGIDGDPRGNSAQFTLPIRPGSNPLTGMKNISVKQGYHFKFDFKSKGNMFSKKDGIRITPTFSYVSKDGGTPIPVDLYYKTNEKPFVQIGSPEDTVQRYVILNERLRNVPLGDMKNSGYWKYDQHLTADEKIGVDREEFMRNYVLKYTNLKTPVGGYDLLMIPEQLKTLIGPKDIPNNASVTPERANASVQHWYAEYSIPADTYAVAAGTNLAEYGRLNGGLTDKSPIFKKDGYIVVNFDIESIQNGKVNDPHLQYIHAPLMNQWKLEGYQNSILDSYQKRCNVKDGDVGFYNADKSSRNDFSTQAPH